MLVVVLIVGSAIGFGELVEDEGDGGDVHLHTIVSRPLRHRRNSTRRRSWAYELDKGRRRPATMVVKGIASPAPTTLKSYPADPHDEYPIHDHHTGLAKKGCEPGAYVLWLYP
jgi:hypothetical protein